MNKPAKKNIIIKCILALIILIFAYLCIIKPTLETYTNTDIIDKSDITSIQEQTTISSTATIGNMGDILIHSPILNAYYDTSSKTYDFEKIFTYIEPYIKKLDYSVINMEGSLTDNNFSGYPMFKCPENIIDSAKKSGFRMFLTANNHSNDNSSAGIVKTSEILNKKNVDYIGTRSKSETPKYIIKDINGIKVAMINYTYGKINDNGIISVNGLPCNLQTSPLLNVFDCEKLDNFYVEQQELIKDMKKDGADIIFYYIHWGIEYQTQENNIQRSIAQKLCDLGVDVIVGGHPHVIQPMDILHSEISQKDTICIYSLGNSISNQRQELMDMKTGHTEDGVLFNVTLTKYSNGTVQPTKVDILPTWVSRYFDKNNKIYQIIPLDKNINWDHNFNLDLVPNGLNCANKSYERTTKLLLPGLHKINNTLSEKLNEMYPEIYKKAQ